MTGVMTLDLSNLILTPEPYKLLNEFASVGLTQSPAGDEYEPNGTLYTLTGSVQWSTTYNDNRISYTGNFNKNTSGGTSIEISYGTGSGKVVLLSDTAQTAGDIDAYDGWIIVDNAAITAGTWYITIYDSDDNVLLNQMVDASALTLAPAPYNPQTDPFFELTGVTYNDHTYSVSDFISGGTLTRGYNGSQNNLLLTGATIKYCGIDPSADQNYYLAFTSRVGAEAEHQGSYYEFTELSLNNPINNPPSPHTIPQTFLVKVNRLTGNINGSGKIVISPGTGQTKTPKIYFQNCTWEADPRPSFTASLKKPPSDATYNGNPITDYWTPATASTGDWTIEYKYNNGYYGFAWLALSESGISDNMANYVDYVDVTSSMSFTGLGANDRVYMYDITSLKASSINALSITFTKPGYPNKTASWLSERDQSLPAYANGLTPRNMAIKPISATVRAEGFSDYCNITFTPIDPATATVVNDEVTVSVSGYLASNTNQRTLGSNLTNYQPMYKNWPNNYSQSDSRNDISFDSGKYFLIFEVSNAFVTIDHSPYWKCKGFTSSQTSFTTMKVPQYMNSTSKSTIWAIPIESGMTSVSIQCVPTSNSTAFTPVTYTFDLTNVTYGTWPAQSFVNNGTVITLDSTDVLYKDAASAGTDTFQAGQYIIDSVTKSTGSTYTGTSGSPYVVAVTALPVATNTWTAGFVVTGGTNGSAPVFETGTSGDLSDWSAKLASDNKTITITHRGAYHTAKVYYVTPTGGTKHVLLTITEAN